MDCMGRAGFKMTPKRNEHLKNMSQAEATNPQAVGPVRSIICGAVVAPLVILETKKPCRCVPSGFPSTPIISILSCRAFFVLKLIVGVHIPMEKTRWWSGGGFKY